MTPDGAKAALIAVLQNAYSGEYAASLAYGGHAKSVSDLREKAEILAILNQELDHRALVGCLLHMAEIEWDHESIRGAGQ